MVPAAGRSTVTWRVLTWAQNRLPSRRRTWRSSCERPVRDQVARLLVQVVLPGRFAFVQAGHRRARQGLRRVAHQVGHRLVGTRDLAVALVDDADVRQVEHQLALARQRLELALLRLHSRRVGQHHHHADRARGGLVRAAQRQGAPDRRLAMRARGQQQLRLQRADVAHGIDQRGDGLGRHAGAREDRIEGLAGRVVAAAQQRLEPAVAADELLAAQVGDAGGADVEDGGELGQQILVAAARRLLLGDIDRHDRERAALRAQLGRLDARHQPAPAALAVAHRVAHLDARAGAQRGLQPLVVGHRFGLHEVAADGHQAALALAVGLSRGAVGRAGARAALHRADPAARRVPSGDADTGGAHQGLDLDAGDVPFVLESAIFQHRDPARGGAAREPAAAAGRHPAHAHAHAHGLARGAREPAVLRASGRQGRKFAGPAQQQLEFRGGVAQLPGQRTQHLGERGVVAKHAAGFVEDDLPQRRHLEPALQLAAQVVDGRGAGAQAGAGGAQGPAREHRRAGFRRRGRGRGHTPPEFTRDSGHPRRRPASADERR